MNWTRPFCRAAHRLGRRLALGFPLAGCGRTASPEAVALAYGRAVYASDTDAIWRLVSQADRPVKDIPSARGGLMIDLAAG